jgi:hypothetical protein
MGPLHLWVMKNPEVHQGFRGLANAVAQSVAGQAATGESSRKASSAVKKLSFIHFNDVYNIEEHPQEPRGGAARFVSKCRELQKVSCLQAAMLLELWHLAVVCAI